MIKGLIGYLIVCAVIFVLTRLTLGEKVSVVKAVIRSVLIGAVALFIVGGIVYLF